MGTSIVDFRGQAFWTRDSAVTVVLALLAVELDSIAADVSELDDLLNRWSTNACLGVTGAVDAGLDDFNLNDEIIEHIRAAIRRVQGRIPAEGLIEVTDSVLLRRARVNTADRNDVPTALAAWVRQVLTVMDQLLTGTLDVERTTYWWVDDQGLAERPRVH